MEKPFIRTVDYWRMDFDELQQLVERMRAIREADAKLVREFDSLSQDEPRDRSQAQTDPPNRAA